MAKYIYKDSKLYRDGKEISTCHCHEDCIEANYHTEKYIATSFGFGKCGFVVVRGDEIAEVFAPEYKDIKVLRNDLFVANKGKDMFLCKINLENLQVTEIELPESTSEIKCTSVKDYFACKQYDGQCTYVGKLNDNKFDIVIDDVVTDDDYDMPVGDEIKDVDILIGKIKVVHFQDCGDALLDKDDDVIFNPKNEASSTTFKRIGDKYVKLEYTTYCNNKAIDTFDLLRYKNGTLHTVMENVENSTAGLLVGILQNPRTIIHEMIANMVKRDYKAFGKMLAKCVDDAKAENGMEE